MELETQPGETPMVAESDIQTDAKPAPAPGPNLFEVRAKEFGWRPADEFNGDPDDWVDAKEFLRRKPLHDALKAERKARKNMEKEMRQIALGMAAMKQHHFSSKLAELKDQRKQALEAGEDELVEKIDEARAYISAEKRQAEREAKSEPVDVAAQEMVQAWGQKNPWYNDDPELRADAENYFAAYAKANPDGDIESALAYVTRKVKATNPDKFPNAQPREQRRPQPSPVEGSRPANGGTQKSKGYHDMPEDARKACDSMVGRGLMTRDAYVKYFFG